MDIEKELRKADLHMGGDLKSDTLEEFQKKANFVTAKLDKGIQLSSNPIIMQDKSTEHATHVPLKITTPREPNNDNVVVYVPKWKRLERQKTLEENVVLSSTTLKRPNPEIDAQGSTKKRRQVPYVNQKNTDVLAEVDVQPARSNESLLLELSWA